MTTSMKILMVTALTAGLFTGSAALAQGFVQSDKVSYALSVIDAGDDGKATSETGKAVTDATTQVRVKVTVSVPRTEDSSRYSITNSANPVRLMYRKHRGPSTAFDGSISLVRDAPYAASGTALKSAYYPMPQVDAAGKEIRDPTKLDYAAVVSGQTENVEGTAYIDYLGNGQAHDPARWEATYLSPAYDVTTLETENPMVYSLLVGDGTYEWYAASRYGMSSFTRISPIQDLARAMSFTDIRLWKPIASTASSDDAARVDSASKITLGDTFEWSLWAMPDEDSGWHIYRGSIGVNDMGSAGAQLLNFLGADTVNYSDYARIESPDYPDGIGSITFDALVSTQDTDAVQELLVQCYTNNQWVDIERLQLTQDVTTYTVDFEGSANGPSRFRLIRASQLTTGGTANTLTMIVRNLFVRSALPQATFSEPTFTPSYPAYNAETPSFDVKFIAEGGEGGSVPRGYSASLALRRRAEGDTTREWKTALVKVTSFNETSGDTILTSTFKRTELTTNFDGTVNANEGAFFLDTAGKVVGLLPGVYDLALNYSIYGSFKAGRDIIDEHETVTGVATTYEVDALDDGGVPIKQNRPNVLDLREHETSHEDVFLRVMYRSGTTDDTAPYEMKTVDIPLLPSSREPNLWRADLSRILKLEDESAVYAWGYEYTDGEGKERVAFTLEKLAFTVYATTGEDVYCYGQKAAVATGTMPPATEVVPAFTESLGEADPADVVPMVLELSNLTSSHVMIEVEMPENPEIGADAFVRAAGSYWQDFNTWYASSESFTETDFRENLRSRVADFDCTVEAAEDGDYYITGGWIPDEGPMADTTSFLEAFEVGREGVDNYPFFMPNLTEQAGDLFAAWGAASARADQQYLRKDRDPRNYKARYMEFNSNAEIVLNRTFHRQSTEYLSDAQIRLRGTGAFVSPLSGGAGGVELNGVGSVSFDLGISLPYDFGHRVRMISSNEANFFGLNGFGVASAIQIPSASTCASSGYSVSYYLDNLFLGEEAYELRLTQILNFSTSNTIQPESTVVAELYKWKKSGDPERLPLAEMSGATITGAYKLLTSSLNGNSFGLWVRSDGKIAVGYAAGTTPTSLTAQFVTKNVVVTAPPAYGYMLAVGSAECRPVFRQFLRSTARANDFAGNALSAITPSETKLSEPITPTWGESWKISDDPNSTRIQITRRTPIADLAGSVAIRAKRADGSSSDAIVYSTDKTGERITAVLGEANATLVIEPNGPESNIFLDNISVSSWCGNDENRNGMRVPGYTDEGFYSANGFAGVGLWVRPDSSDQLNAAPSEYRGSQCLLMHRSRRNYELSDEVETDGVLHTGASLALYGPYTTTGFGPVTFRYCIPELDEYGGSGDLPSAYVMLQYLESSTYYNNYLEDVSLREWKNVSDPVELRNTQGEWRSASITPKLNGEELVGVRGTLRLVMVIKSSDEDYDPYVYIDDFTVTDNASGTLASWSAQNVKLTDNPVNQLYWKDRVPTTNADPAEESFAEKSTLTRAMQFNDEVSGYDTDNTYYTCVLNSPLLTDGVGRVSFAARLTEESDKPVRLYIMATESEADVELATFEPVTYVEVTNTVYNVFDVDLSKYTFYYTTPDANLLPKPDSGNTEKPFTASAARRIQVRAYLENDGVTTDGFGAKPNPGRVLMDMLSISNPILPSLRVESVAFSNVAGADAASAFDRQSPLSQPVSNAPVLRVMVELGHMQLLRDDSIRVFFTMKSHNIDDELSNVKRYTDLNGGYSYEDVLGNIISASEEQPIYAWKTEKLEQWQLSKWFNLSNALTFVNPEMSSGPLTVDELEAIGLKNTVELKRDGNHFFGNLTELGMNALPVNSLVQYTAWAVYKSEESEQWYTTQISPSTHTDFPWYFPRNLNMENRTKYAEERCKNAGEDWADEEELAKYDPGANFFSPYYWVYSCVPGEVFVNEFNLRDQVNVEHNVKSFVEVCAPAGLDIGEWRLDFSRSGTELNATVRWPIAQNTVLKKPAAGAVPAQRKAGTSSNRSFYTVFTSDSGVFHTKNGDPDPSFGSYADTMNAGIATRGWETATLPNNTAACVQLVRPTGGAEHIVIFSTYRQNAIDDPVNSSSLEDVDELYDTYRSAYISKGFGSEWYQTFQDASWQEYIAGRTNPFGEIKLLEANLTQARAHGRRLTKANFFPSAGATTNYRFDQNATTFQPVQDYATMDYPNSIATIDMGGMWVTRLNADNTNAIGGPLDLTELYDDAWPKDYNPVEQSRRNEPTPDSIPTGANAPYTQVTPRQINLDQYLIPYTGIAQSFVVSELEGNLLGTHELGLYNTAGEILETRRGGRATPNTWSLNQDVTKVQLAYKALPFQLVTSVKLRLLDAKSAEPEMDPDKIQKQIPDQTIASGPDAEGWITLQIPAAATEHSVDAFLKKVGSGSDEDRYNIEAKASFGLDPNPKSKDIITKVSPYCGGTLSGSALYQPWWGSSFGFEVTYDPNEELANHVALSGVIVTYPSPAGLKQGFGLQSPWAGLTLTYTPDPVSGITPPDETVSLVGKEYGEAIELLKTVFGPKGNARFVEIKSASDGRVVDTSLVGILSNTYATEDVKEPAIPFCVWGVYTYTVQSDVGNEKVSFLMPQATPGEKSTIFEQPVWYKPLANLNEGRLPEDTAPYFYLYSTPPQAAWLNEVNLHNGGTGSAPYAEVVMPKLRDGILNATPAVPQTTNDGWSVARYTAAGELAGQVALGDATTPSYSSSYTYTMVDIASIADQAQSAYVLVRPCGAAEGGAWLAVDDAGNNNVPAPATLSNNEWLINPACHVVPGKTDSSTVAGSVQLVGQVITESFNGVSFEYLSSAIADRTDWKFAAESKNMPNDGDLSPDIAPEWNRVTITSTLRNTVYGGVLCGYQKIPGFFETTGPDGVASTEGPITHTLGGADWVYDAALGRTMVLSYRPRTNYRFESITLPPELIGHVMLIGAEGKLTQAEVAAKVAELRAKLTTNPDAPVTDWIRLGGRDINQTYRATVEYTSYTDEVGVEHATPTGVITFNPDYVVSAPGEDEVTFGDQSDYVITLVFVDEPASAQNRIEVAMGQGDVQFGAWLVTQTFWAQDETGAPDPEKGGDTVEKPIWSDEDGNVDGDHSNRHGWLHQPIVGDKIGMSAVINPELGLTGGKIGRTVEDVRDRLATPNTSLRPFLVWTLIPKEKVPVEVFSGSGNAATETAVAFFNNWALTKWIGGSPAVGDQTTVNFSTLRQTLQATVESDTGFYRAAGIIPMAYRGYCDENREVGTDPAVSPRGEDTLLAFSTMTEEQLNEALTTYTVDTGLSNDNDALLPYTSTIDMTDEALWKDGAVLRFAIILADPNDGFVYDCQALANFSSDELAIYCPWYVPDPVANINRTTSAQNAGISPFAWVYSIARGGVWLNEIRPFATYSGTLAADGTETITMPSVVELAMQASPLETRTDGNYVAKHSLDGWKLVMKTAPMPLADASPETPLEWDVQNTVDLVSWIPYRRIDPDYEPGTDGNTNYYDLDFYCATTDVRSGFATDNTGSFLHYGYPNADTTVTEANFKWLKLANELFEKDLETTLRATEKYAAGVVYAIALVRNNGVVVDEVLFYNSAKGLDPDTTATRMELAIASENANNCVASTVRGITLVPLPAGTALASTAQFVKYVPDTTDPTYDYTWVVEMMSSSLNTLPGANIWSGYLQPQLDYVPSIAAYSLLTARILGSDAILSLAKANGEMAISGTTLSTSYLTGSAYTLSISDWNRDWFKLESVQKNGQTVAPLISTGTTYALNENGFLAATQTLLVDEGTLTGNTDYALTFVYTPEAAKLFESGALNSADDGFLSWLLQTDPEAILNQTNADGVTAAEKYWLGLDSALIDASDVNLEITAIGTHAEPTETLPTINVALTKGETAISELTGDGMLILIGKETMEGEWQYIRRLYPEDINGESTLILRTPCTFFKVLLLSEAQAEGYKE